MSRGFGTIQRAIIDALAGGEAIGTLDLICVAYKIEPNADDGVQYFNSAQHAAVRRALIGLEKQGLVSRAGRERSVLWQSVAAVAEERVKLIRRAVQLTLDDPTSKRAVMQFLHEEHGIDGAEIYRAAKDLVLQWPKG